MLNVDDFGIQYMGMQHAQHLITVLKQDYEAVTTDWGVSYFVASIWTGITRHAQQTSQCQGMYKGCSQILPIHHCHAQNINHTITMNPSTVPSYN
jgi:hypothetical protein